MGVGACLTCSVYSNLVVPWFRHPKLFAYHFFGSPYLADLIVYNCSNHQILLEFKTLNEMFLNL